MNEQSSGQPAQQVRLSKAKDGSLLVPSIFKNDDGEPRFAIPVPQAALKDMAIRFMVERETRYGGFEYPTRAFLDTHLEPGDLFIDVGAHWGVMALTAATRFPGEIAALAIEAHPTNVTHLLHAVSHNGLQDSIEVIASAAGDAPGTAPLITNTSMGHSLHALGLQGLRQGAMRLSIPLVTLDTLMAERPQLAERRTMLKIDVEGFEPQVVAGAQKLLESGRVAALIWEKGRAFNQEPAKSALGHMLEWLDSLGFTHHVLAAHDLGGPLLPFVPHGGSCNVYSLAAGFKPRPVYVRPPGPVPPVAPSNKVSDDPEERAELTEALISVKGSDGARWSDPEFLAEGAQERAQLAAKHAAAGESVLDLGAGLMHFGRALPKDCRYVPADLVPFTRHTVVLDLNRGDFPKGDIDVIAALELLEYIHDVPALLKRCADGAGRLLCTYRCRDGEDLHARRRQGWVNDFTEAEFRDHLAAAGWAVETTEEGAGTTLFVCRRTGF